jgi:hypothetical protein
MDIKEKVGKRQEANRKIIEILSDIIEKKPELRFGQILAITGVIEYEEDARPYIHDFMVKDPFNEESVDMLFRMKDKMII